MFFFKSLRIKLWFGENITIFVLYGLSLRGKSQLAPKPDSHCRTFPLYISPVLFPFLYSTVQKWKVTNFRIVFV